MIHINFDGSFRPKKLENVWWGFVAFNESGQMIHFAGGRERVESGNPHVSELRALLHAMEWASRDYMDSAVEFVGDNAALIKLMRGEARGKAMKSYQPLLQYLRTKHQLGWQYRWVPRGSNHLADSLATTGSNYLTPALARLAQ